MILLNNIYIRISLKPLILIRISRQIYVNVLLEILNLPFKVCTKLETFLANYQLYLYSTPLNPTYNVYDLSFISPVKTRNGEN